MKYSISDEYESIVLDYLEECNYLISKDMSIVSTILGIQNNCKYPKIIPENLIKYKHLLQERSPKELIRTAIGWRLIAEACPEIRSSGSDDLDLNRESEEAK